MGERPLTPPLPERDVFADARIKRLRKNARELDRLIKRGGLQFGVMTPEKAEAYLSEAEAAIAEVRRSAESEAASG